MKSFKGPEVVAIVSARGRSKGLPGKNIREFCGRPLIDWSITAALQAACVDRVIVTSDDQEIIDTAVRAGAEAPFVRPDSLAGDEVPGIEPVLHAVEWLREHNKYTPPWVLLLQPTSPLRTHEDIDASYRLAKASTASAVIGVSLVRSHPYWTKCVDEQGFLHDFIPLEHKPDRRQGLPTVYVVNGAIYLIETQVLLESRTFNPPRSIAFRMPYERSIDIDDQFDFDTAEMLFRRSQRGTY